MNAGHPDYPAERTEQSLAVLLRIVRELDPPADSYRVVGGLATKLLTREHALLGPHVGSMDVDFVFSPEAWKHGIGLSERLLRAGLEPEGGDKSSMYWFARVSPGVTIPVDLLAPRPTDASPEYVEVSGVRAWAPPGSGAVLQKPGHVAVSGQAWGTGRVEDASIVVPSGASMIMSKARSLWDRIHERKRREDLAKAGKHAYDLFCLITGYSAGQAALADEWRELGHHLLKERTLRILTDEFSDASSTGSALAGQFMGAILGPSAGLAQGVSEQIRMFVESVR